MSTTETKAASSNALALLGGAPVGRLQLIGKLLRIVGSESPYVTLLVHGVFATLSDKYVDPTYSAYTFGASVPWAMGVKLAR